jgi:hypothetical protein
VGFSDPAGDVPGTGELIALRQDFVLESLGVWPLTDQAEPQELATILGPGDEALVPGADAFASFLVVDRNLVGAAYSRLSDQGGFAFAYSLETDGGDFIPAPAAFSAAVDGENLWVNGGGLGDVTNGLGVYIAGGGDIRQIAALGEGAFSGFTASTTNGIMVLGRFTTQNELFAFPRNDLLTQTSLVDLAAETPFLASAEIGGVTGFGAGVAVTRIDESFTGVALDFIGLSEGANGVQANPALPVLEPVDAACTSIAFSAPFANDIIVGLRDERGLRVVHLRKTGG